MIPITAKGATSVELFHLGRSVVSLKADHGLIAIASSDIGNSACSVIPVAHYLVNGKSVSIQGAPINIAPQKG